MIRWVTELARIGLIVAAIAATVPMIAFAQANEPAIEGVPAEADAVTASPTGNGSARLNIRHRLKHPLKYDPTGDPAAIVYPTFPLRQACSEAA